MRIAYGVHGYGRGHAMRALAVLPALTQRHEVLILAGSEAYSALAPGYPVVRIPTFKYHYDRRGRLSNYLNIRHNLPGVLDVRLRGPGLDLVVDLLRDFRPDVVVTDSEACTHRAAQHLRIPRISFDHFGLLVYCRLNLGWRDELVRRGNARAYRFLFGEPQRAIVSSFFDAPATRPGVAVVGPVMRAAVREVPPRAGDYLLVYFSKGEHEYTPQIERALAALPGPVRVYGTGRQDARGNVCYRPFGNRPFLEDLAGCRAVFATTGNQLLGEVLHYRKPILGMPIACLEQRINARQIGRLGIGAAVERRQVTSARLREFLDRVPEYADRFPSETRDGAAEAVAALERFAAELVTSPEG